MSNLKQQIVKVRQSIVAIGFNPSPDKITILGSGFIVNGKIVTCAHILKNLNEEQIKSLKADVMVGEPGDLEAYMWMSVKINPEKKDIKNDLAVLEFDPAPEGINIKSLTLGNSDEIETGQDIYFIGFPYAAQLINDGFGITLMANRGIVGNIKRDIEENKRNWFIVDAISNPGNSGCPLINAENNEVIGVMSISFRTPSSVIKELDIREPMHIAGAKPINLVKELLN